MPKNYSKGLRSLVPENILMNLEVAKPEVRYWFNLSAPHDGILCALDEDSDAVWWDNASGGLSVNEYNAARSNDLVEVDRKLAEAILKLIED